MNKTILLTFLIVTGAWAGKLAAQNMTVKYTDGTEKVKAISSLTSVLFANNYLTIRNNDGTTESSQLSGVRKICFKYCTTSTTDTSGNATLTQTAEAAAMAVYPNPVGDFIYVQNAPEGTSFVNICRIDGAVVLQTQISLSGQPLNVTGLAKGIYFIKINNQVFKFMKL
jgi:hypothetical protein